MSAINQKEYLKRYLSGADGSKKKKKKKKDKIHNPASKGLVIVDADLGSLSSIPFGMDDQDDAPTVAEITYDSVKTKLRDEYETSVGKWKKTTESEEGGEENGDRQIGKQKVPGQSHSANNAGKAAVGRKHRHDTDPGGESPPPKVQGEVSDVPPRKQMHDSDSDESPLRIQKVNESASSRNGRHDSNSDESPPRPESQISKSKSVYNSKKIHEPDSDASPPRLQPHKSNHGKSRGSRWDPDDVQDNEKVDSRSQTVTKKSRYDSDESPPRSDSRSRPVTKKSRYDSDESPPRRSRGSHKIKPNKPTDSDESPPRRRNYDSDESPPRKSRKVDSDESPPRNNSLVSNKPAEIRPEKKMTTREYLQARKRGKLKKDSPEELARKEREGELQREAEVKHQQWNRGVAQLQQQQQRVDDIAHEMTKSFARTADDVDMNEHCKSKLLSDDPMLAYLSNKDKKGGSGPRKPLYQGNFPPNRLNIRPGYRWDGVDRSTGFEQDYFAKQSSKVAIEEDAYKYCAEDM